MEKILNNNYDYVITTEGRFDNQSFEGKATGEIIKLFSTRAKNIFLVCGYAEKNMQDILPQNVHIIELKNYFNSIEQSINNPGAGLKISAEKIIELIKFRTHLELK
jgi:glycerate kinase